MSEGRVVYVFRERKRDDSTFTFRVDSQLKMDFAQLCEREHFSAATALKRYMSHCVSKGRIVS